MLIGEPELDLKRVLRGVEKAEVDVIVKNTGTRTERQDTISSGNGSKL